MELHISLVGRQDLSGEIYRQLRQAILDDRLRPGDRLPPSRELARSLNVSRTTVTVAYERLAGAGFVLSRVGSGTFVSDQVVLRRVQRRRPSGGSLCARALWDSIPTSTAFARPAEFDFRSGLPDASLFPFETWRRLTGREWRAAAIGRGVYGDPAGHDGLREAIARHLAIVRGVSASATDVIVANGTQQALDVIARALLAPGDRVAVEDPGYRPPRWLFQSLGLRVQGVPVDGEGLVVDGLHPRTRLVYATPSHQYPLGMSMSLARRRALLDWAECHDAAIVEDDYDSEFRFYGRPIEPLRTLDVSARVIYVGSFSKTMLPTLRVGFILAPSSVTEALRTAKFVTDWHTSLPTQAALASFVEGGAFARHVRKMSRVYQERHEMLVKFIERNFSDHLELVPSAAGLHVAALARSGAEHLVDRLQEKAAEVGVAVQDLADFASDVEPVHGLVLGYGAIPASRMPDGLARLRGCLDRLGRSQAARQFAQARAV